MDRVEIVLTEEQAKILCFFLKFTNEALLKECMDGLFSHDQIESIDEVLGFMYDQIADLFI